MKYILPKIVILSLILLFLTSVKAPLALAAPHFLLDPSSLTAKKDDQITILVRIDTESQLAVGGDTVINYPGDDLDVVAVGNGGYFSDFYFSNVVGSRVEMHGFFSGTNQSKAGLGTFASIIFRVKKNSGTGVLNFSCWDTNSTQIIDTKGNNINSCGALNQTILTYSTIYPTPTPTPTPTPSYTVPSCTGLSVSPQSGTTPLLITFTCSGSINYRDITSAEFTFGDGTTSLIEKNIGEAGSISVTHNYTKVGSYGTYCRMRDNNYHFSDIPENCKQNVVVNAVVTPTHTPTPTPTPVMVPRYETPIPEETPLITITETEAPTEIPTPTETPIITTSPIQAYSPLIIFGVIAVVLIGLALYLLK